MDHADEARSYLLRALRDHGVDLAVVSRAIGHKDAYIQQYTGASKSRSAKPKAPRPRYLSEADRKALIVVCPFLNEERLMPEPRIVASIPKIVGNVLPAETKIADEVGQETKALLLLRSWKRIPSERHDLALRVLRAFEEEGTTQGAGTG